MFEIVLDRFENNDLKELAKEMIETIPPYFYEVPASSSGKYHPSYCLGQGGLYRHTLALCNILEHLFVINNFTSRERDMMRIAGIMHDSRKSGSQESYENDPMTKFEHPILAANIIRTFKQESMKYYNYEIEIIAGCVETHMGQWNESKYSNAILPKPNTAYEKLVHTADYLASRKDIEVKFDGE